MNSAGEDPALRGLACQGVQKTPRDDGGSGSADTAPAGSYETLRDGIIAGAPDVRRVPEHQRMEIVPLEGNASLPRGIADARGLVGFVSAGEGVERLDLRTGQQVWSSGLARYPVALWRSRLLALQPSAGPSAVQLVALDAVRPGPVLLSSAPIPLPPDLLRDERHGLVGVTVADDVVTLQWAAEQAYEGGAPPPEHVERAAARPARGLVRVSLRTGSVEVGEGDAAFERPPTGFVTSDGGEWRTGTWTVHGETVRLVMTLEAGRQRVWIEFVSSSPGDRPPRVALAEGAALVPVVSLDRAHVLVRDEAQQAGPPASVFSLERRAVVGSITWEAGADEAVVFGDRVLYVLRRVERGATPESLGTAVVLLKARGLPGDRVLWEHPLAREQTGPRRVRP